MTGTSKKRKVEPFSVIVGEVRGVVYAETASRYHLTVTESPYPPGFGAVGATMSVPKRMARRVGEVTK